MLEGRAGRWVLLMGHRALDWARLDQPTFDRIVEALVRHRFGDEVRAVNGRGGDDGIDIEVTLANGRLWILQLKFYPEGFSSVWGSRAPISESPSRPRHSSAQPGGRWSCRACAAPPSTSTS